MSRDLIKVAATKALEKNNTSAKCIAAKNKMRSKIAQPLKGIT